MQCVQCGGTEFIQDGKAASTCRMLIGDTRFGSDGSPYITDWVQPDRDTFMPERTKCVKCGAEDYTAVYRGNYLMPDESRIQAPIYAGTMIPFDVVFDVMKYFVSEISNMKEAMSDPEEQSEKDQEVWKRWIEDAEYLFGLLSKYSGIENVNTNKSR